MSLKSDWLLASQLASRMKAHGARIAAVERLDTGCILIHYSDPSIPHPQPPVRILHNTITLPQGSTSFAVIASI
jgi:hypothetical protein